MKLDDLARTARNDLDTATRSTPVVPIEKVARRRLVTLASTMATMAVVGLAVLVVLGRSASGPVVAEPSTTTVTPTTVTATTIRAAPVELTIDRFAETTPLRDTTVLLPWGDGEGQVHSAAGRGPCCVAVTPDGVVLVLDQGNRRVVQLRDGIASTLADLDVSPAAIAATTDRIFVYGTTATGAVLVVLDPGGAEMERMGVTGGDQPLLIVDSTHVWVGVTGVLPAEVGFASRQWFPILKLDGGEPESARRENRPLPGGGGLGVDTGKITLLAGDQTGVEWLLPPGIDPMSVEPYDDGVVIILEDDRTVGYVLRPDGSVSGLSLPDRGQNDIDGEWRTAVSGSFLVTVGRDQRGVIVSTVDLLDLDRPATAIDVSGLAVIGMTQFGEVLDENAQPFADVESFAWSWQRMAWDGDRGIVYIDEMGALRHVTPDGDRSVTGSLDLPEQLSVLDVVEARVAISTQPGSVVWIDLATGAPVDGPDDRDLLDATGLVLVEQGRRVRIDWPDWTDVPRGEGGGLTGDFDLPELVVEDAATGRELGRFPVTTGERPYAAIHDFDGRRVIVSRFPYEPANPPMTVLFLDLECWDCGRSIETAGPVSWSLVGIAPSAGPVQPWETS